MDGNGVTRREFDRLEARVDLIYMQGSPQVRELHATMNTEVQALRRETARVEATVEADLRGLREATDKRLSTLTRIAVGIFLALFTGMFAAITALVLELAR